MEKNHEATKNLQLPWGCFPQNAGLLIVGIDKAIHGVENAENGAIHEGNEGCVSNQNLQDSSRHSFTEQDPGDGLTEPMVSFRGDPAR